MKNKLLLFFLFSMFGWTAANAQVNCTAAPGGTVATLDGATTVYTCPGDGNPDVVEFTNTATGAANFAYAITDANNIIIGINTGNSQDFEGAGTGNCFVWGFSYNGTITAQPGDFVFSTQFSDQCWFITNNAVAVVRSEVDGGTVETPQGTTAEYICLNDGIPDFVGFKANTNSGANYRFVITDDQNNILGLPPVDFLDFSGAGPGVCRVWGLSYTGDITASVGDNAAAVALSDGCFDLSDNFIEVVRAEVDGGTVSTPSGENRVYTCTGDGMPSVVDFVHQNAVAGNYAYAITNGQNIILEITTNNSMDFNDAPTGICRVFGFSYSGDITAQAGDLVYTTQFSNGCWEISSNAIEVVRTFVDGGTVAMPSGATRRYTCPGDGIDDIVMFMHTNNAPGTQYAYVITDDQNNILGLPPGNSQNFEGAGTGVCRVWGLSYTGTITAQMGDNAAAVALTDGCFELSENFIEVIRDNPDGGTVATVNGETEVMTCASDGVDDIISFSNQTSSLAAFRYVITDDQNIILGLPPVGSNMQNFDGAGPGVCRVWGLSYTGQFTGAVGDNAATTALSNDCFELSSNFITVTRYEVDGGTVAMPSGATRRYTCPGDGNDDIVMFTHVNNGSMGTQYAYVITDDQNNILGLPPGNSQNFEGAGVGVCRVWGLSYTGTITAQMGDNAAAVALTDGCFELSENFIEVIRDNPDGGTVETVNGETEVMTCASDGVDDIISFSNETSSLAAFRYVITDDQNNILGLPPVGSNMQNFDGAGPGVCRVWGLSYTGQFTGEVGDNAATTALSNDCFELSSNFITVTRYEVDGGTVAMPSGATRRYTCPGDGNDDIVMFMHTNNGSMGTQYAYVITDDQNNILGLPPGNSQNFEGAGTGICRVWGLSYTGTITAQMGDNAAAVALTDGCFELSENFIEVIRDNPDGGTVETVNGETEVMTCASDGVDDIISFSNETSSLAAFRYVITDDQNNILGLPPVGSNMQNFDGAGPGVCRVWGLSYTGQFTGEVGDNAATTALSNDCFELSSNFITVTRYEVDGGMVAMPSGATRRYTCPGDGNDDIVMFTHTNNGSMGTQYAYVITDDQNNILGLPPSNSQNFEGAGIGVCRVWGLSYTGMITAQVGDNAAAVALTDGCFELSENFIEVIRDNPDGGTVATVDGETEVMTCAGDGADDIIQFTHQTSSLAAFRYIITDDQNIILGIPPAGVNEQNFEGAGAGVCRVWGVSYTGQLTAEPGDDAAAIALSNDCFELSSNFIEVIRNTTGGACDPLQGGTIIRNQAQVNTSKTVYSQLEAYPNPVVEQLTYVFEQTELGAQTYQLQLTDVSGKVVLANQFTAGKGIQQRSIQLDGLAPGLYFLQLQSSTQQWTTKVSKL